MNATVFKPGAQVECASPPAHYQQRVVYGTVRYELSGGNCCSRMYLVDVGSHALIFDSSYMREVQP